MRGDIVLAFNYGQNLQFSLLCFQKSKKIFDPADHDQPSRKRKVSDSIVPCGNTQSTFTSTNVTMPVLSSPRSSQGVRQTSVVTTSPTMRGASANITKTSMISPNASGSQSSSNPVKSFAIKRENACMYCGLDTPKHKKGRIEHLLRCKDCVNIGKINLK